MVRILNALHNRKPRKPFFTWRNLSYATIHQHLPSDISINSISSNPCFTILTLCRSIRSLKRAHALFIVHGLTGNLLCDTKLLSSYGSFGKLSIARLVFDRMTKPDLYSWKVMIRWYFLHNRYLDIIKLYTLMRKCLKEYDNGVFSIVLKACCELRDIDVGMILHCQIVKVGNPDSFVLTGLVDMYAKCKLIECSRRVFDDTADRNVVSWTSMINGYLQNNCVEEGFVLFNRMREDLVEINQYTLGSLVSACSKLEAVHQGKWFHGFVLKNGIELNSHLATALLDMYIKCGAINDATSVFGELSTTDLVSWTAMIVGYTQSGFPEKALKLFTGEKWIDNSPNNVTISSVLSACGQSENLSLGKSTHCYLIKLGLDDPAVTSALVYMYTKCHMIKDAHFIFSSAPEKNIIAWNSMIYGYSLNECAYEALELFNHMRLEAYLPDAVTLVSVFSACASIGACDIGSSLHAYSIKVGLLSYNVYVGTALLNCYAKCGDANSARIIFNNMNKKNQVTWSAMISGYGVQGDSCGSISLFGDMLKDELKPNDIIFTTILSACSHTGKVEEGLKYFNSIPKPIMKHYACMVDLLARAGKLEEAWNFVKKMPVRPDVSIFGAFLHGCGMHSRFDLGEMATKRMLELHPDEACYYILVSNLYASDGRWNQVKQMRELMTRRGLSKSPACSRVDMDIDNNFAWAQVASGS